MLAIWAAKADARLALNEISPLRRDCLNALFPAARVTGHNAELIDELLDPAIIPSVVLMNPPYSHGIERGHDSRTGARHLRSAWNRLASGGRLVAIMPEWFDCDRFLAVVKWPASLRVNRSEEHTSELQSLMRISYAVFCLKKQLNTDIFPNTYYKLT